MRIYLCAECFKVVDKEENVEIVITSEEECSLCRFNHMIEELEKGNDF